MQLFKLVFFIFIFHKIQHIIYKIFKELDGYYDVENSFQNIENYSLICHYFILLFQDLKRKLNRYD